MSNQPEIDWPEPGDDVTHCNQRTQYELVVHAYQPGRCTECGRIYDLRAEVEPDIRDEQPRYERERSSGS